MSTEQNATPGQRSIDDQLISIVAVAEALGYRDAAELIQAWTMERMDKKIAEASEPRYCGQACMQVVNCFGYPLPKHFPHSDYDGVHGKQHDPFCDDSDGPRAACRHHVPLYGPASYWTRHKCNGRPTYRCPACWACAYSENGDVLQANLRAIGYPPPFAFFCSRSDALTAFTSSPQ